jgi:glucokinase
MSNPVFLGVDIGGTKVAAAAVDGSGKILCQHRVPMNSKGDAAAGLAAVIEAIDKVRSTFKGEIAAIGMSAPGPLDPRSGVVVNPPNVPCWRNYPLKAEVERVYGLPVRLDNDANAAGLAETLWGAAIGYTSVFYATIGTGIGTGIVIDGRLYHGRTGAAAEGGHAVIDYSGPYKCSCGKTGCIEAMAAGPAIAKRARAKVAADGVSGRALLDLANGDVNAITGEMVGQAWRGKDPLAEEVLVEVADVLTVWLGSMIDILEPEVIVIGGGVGELISNFFDRISNNLPKWSINQRCCEIPLKLAHYQADSGVAGGAAICRM